MLGNPPWDSVEFREQEFFARLDPGIADLPGARRKQRIRELSTDNPDLFHTFQGATRQVEATRHVLTSSGRFPLCGRGKVNTSSVFVEGMRDSLSPVGQVGVVVPTGIATDDTTKFFFQDVVRRGQIRTLFDFRNAGFFPGVASAQGIRFCLFTLSSRSGGQDPEFVFRATSVADLEDQGRRFTLSAEDLARVNPNSGTCPIFLTRRDAEIARTIYRRLPILSRDGDPAGNEWGVTFKQGLFNMTSDSDLFRRATDLEADGWRLDGSAYVSDAGRRMLPLIEAKMFHLFDHQFGTFGGMNWESGEVRQIPHPTISERRDPTFVTLPRYWVSEEEVNSRAHGAPFLLCFRDITSSLDERATICATIPLSGVGHTAPIAFSSESNWALAAVMSSFAFDYFVRTKLGGTHLTFGLLKQVPIPGPRMMFEGLKGRLSDLCADLVLELTCTSWDQAPVSLEIGGLAAALVWDSDRRRLLRAELDALMFHLYGIERDDVDYIMETFPIVKRKDEAALGHALTKRLILERYDAMAEAEAAGVEYETCLDPPPADPTLCHPESTRPDWARPVG